MTDEKTFTKTELDAAIEAAVAKVQESVDRLEAKNTELVGDLRKARKAGEIKPEDLTAAEERADKAEAALAEAGKTLKTLGAEKDKAVKALESEQGAARSYALEAEISSAIAAGNVVPALIPGFKAMVKQNAKAELVDGKYVVTYGDKPASEAIKALLDSDDGKAWRAAAVNGGGGALGSSGATGGKTVTRSAFDGMEQSARATFAKEGGKVVEA